MLKIRSTYDERPIYQTSYDERMAFLRYYDRLRNHKIIGDSVRKWTYHIPTRNFSTLSVTVVSRSYDKLKVIVR